MEVKKGQEKVVKKQVSWQTFSTKCFQQRGTNLTETSLAFCLAVVKINLYKARKGGRACCTHMNFHSDF